MSLPIDKLASFSSTVTSIDAFATLGTCVFFALLLRVLYRRFSTTFGSKTQLADVLVLIAMTTAIIILIVKSSLALSLGLVGALSIVRFRTAIKDPEELGFMFVAIAIGLGCGSGHWHIVFIFMAVVSILILVRSRCQTRRLPTSAILLQFESESPNISAITETLRQIAPGVRFQKMEPIEDRFSLSFFVDTANTQQLDAIKSTLSKQFGVQTLSYFSTPVI